MYVQWEPSEYDEDFLDNDMWIPLQPWASLAYPWSLIFSKASPHGDGTGFPKFFRKHLKLLLSIQFHLKVNDIQSTWKLFPSGEMLFFFCSFFPFFFFFQKWPEEVNPISAPRGWLRGEDHSLVTWHLRRHEGEWFILFLSFTPSLYIPIYHCHTFTYTMSLILLSSSISFRSNYSTFSALGWWTEGSTGLKTRKKKISLPQPQTESRKCPNTASSGGDKSNWLDLCSG